MNNAGFCLTGPRRTTKTTPVFTGTGVPVPSLFNFMERGETIDAFLENLRSVKQEQAIQVLEMEKNIDDGKDLP